MCMKPFDAVVLIQLDIEITSSCDVVESKESKILFHFYMSPGPRYTL